MRPIIWIGHIALKVNSLEASEQFYPDLGLRQVFKNDAVCIVELRGGTHLILAKQEDPQPGDVEFDFMVENLDEVFALYTEKGLNVSEITRGDIHDSFYLTDPTGNRIIVNSTHVADHTLV